MYGKILPIGLTFRERREKGRTSVCTMSCSALDHGASVEAKAISIHKKRDRLSRQEAAHVAPGRPREEENGPVHDRKRAHATTPSCSWLFRKSSRHPPEGGRSIAKAKHEGFPPSADERGEGGKELDSGKKGRLSNKKLTSLRFEEESPKK